MSPRGFSGIIFGREMRQQARGRGVNAQLSALDAGVEALREVGLCKRASLTYQSISTRDSGPRVGQRWTKVDV